MQLQSVPLLSILGMIFSLLISIGLPFALCILVRRKMKAKVSSFFIGCLTFVIFALILEQLLHGLVFTLSGTYLTERIWLYALYGGLAAAAFEETGRFLSMKLFMKKNITRENAVMYGIGHGGIEAILIVGLSSLSNLLTTVMINTGGLEKSLSILDSTLRETTIQRLSVLWTTPGHMFFLAGIERIIAIALHICLSVLVYKTVSGGKKCFFMLAFALHFLVDFVTVVAASYISLIWVEAVLFVMIALIAFFTLQVYKRDTISII